MFKNLFPQKYPLIGMIHLPPLPGYPRHGGMDAVINKALLDLQVLEKAHFAGVLIENDNDQPHQIGVSVEIQEAFLQVVQRIVSVSTIPVGMEIIYDMPKTVEIAAMVGANFVRLDFFVDGGNTQWGVVQPQTGYLTELRQTLSPDLMLLTDIQVKHADILTPRPLSESAYEAEKVGSNGIIVTGDWTGQRPKLVDLQAVQALDLNIPTIVGSGMNVDNAIELMCHSQAAIIGTSIKSGEYIDYNKAVTLFSVVNKKINNATT